MVKKSFKIFLKKLLQKRNKFPKEIIDAKQYFKEEKFDSALNSLNSLTQEQIKELPISYKGRAYDEGKKITWLDGIQAIWTLIKYRFID